MAVPADRFHQRFCGRGELTEDVFGYEWAGVVEALHRARQDGRRAEDELEEVVEECLSRLRG